MVSRYISRWVVCATACAVLAPASVSAGPYASGNIGSFNLRFWLTAGPTVGGGVSIAEDKARGVVSVGAAGALIQNRWSKLSLAAALDGGVKFPDTYGFVHLNVGVGKWLLTGGPSFVVAFNGVHAGFALGPELTAHIHFTEGDGEELQLSARGDFFAAGGDHFPHAAVVLLKFVLNIMRWM